MGMGVVLVSERNSDGKPVLRSDEGEEVRHVQPHVTIVLANSPPQQPGTLYITTKRLIWLSDTSPKGYAVDFISLSLHAVSRDAEAYPLPCIYTQIDTSAMEEEAEYEDDEADYEDDAAVARPESQIEGDLSLSRVHEMRFVPSDVNVLDHLFRVLCECALLNPDPEGEQEGEGEWFFNEEEVNAGMIGYSNGSKQFDITNISELQIDDDQRFEDADEMEGEGGEIF